MIIQEINTLRNLVKKSKKKFSYNSFENKDYLSIADLKKLIKNFKF